MDHEAVLSRKGLRTDHRVAEVAAVLEAQLPSAYRLASWILRDPGVAEDAVADAMLRAWERRSTLRDPATIDAWFTRILTNVCRDLLRRRRRSVTIGWKPPVLEADPGVDPSDRDEVGRGLELLTPDERILLALRHGRDLTVPMIATQLGVPEGTVKSRRQRVGHDPGNLLDPAAAGRRAAMRRTRVRVPALRRRRRARPEHHRNRLAGHPKRDPGPAERWQ